MKGKRPLYCGIFQNDFTKCINVLFIYIAVIEGGIAQAVPEHPKRENIFSLSTAFGDAYLFQVILLMSSHFLFHFLVNH